jgi:hypothetical protein
MHTGPRSVSPRSRYAPHAAPGSRDTPAGQPPPSDPSTPSDKPPTPVLFQSYFRSIGPRTYAAQVKRAGNGNHFLVITEGQRDPATSEIRKRSVCIFSEDFPAFFHMLRETANYIRANPVPPEVARRQKAYWQKQPPTAAPPTR